MPSACALLRSKCGALLSWCHRTVHPTARMRSKGERQAAMGIIARIKGEEPGFSKESQHARQGKGHYGEYLAEYALEHGRLGNAAVFSNVLVPRACGPTSASEIDVVMLHEKGVFVFESKNYSGWIFGSALVWRNGKYGPFVGCSSYPRCRYIRKASARPGA